MTITRKKALCVFYGKPFSEEIAKGLEERLDSYNDDLEICFETSPERPILVTKSRIYFDPFTYKLYLDEDQTLEESEPTEKLYSDSQIIQFLNIAFATDQFLEANDCYEKKTISSKDVYTTILKYTNKFDDKSLLSFTSWCKTNKIQFMNATLSRKRRYGVNSRLREVFVLKIQYLDNTVKDILNRLPTYQQHIRMLKDDGYCIVGYARKSPGNESHREKNLESMVKHLKMRSLVNKCFVSSCCKASSPLGSRDVKTGNVDLKGVDGNTQDLIRFLSSETKVCLVCIDFAGLSTDPNDLYSFVSNHQSLLRLVVDQLPYLNETKIFERDQILSDASILSSFDCREKALRRSKEM
ncbi:hypothetical protein DM01DRAFT_1336810 [Hesseltinella vesiculosa]|uniref:Uncharacterized protein n=1 Tax=Hesseltinella vesiculosa TaxID=101127 RepID=A0A1X2GFB5_9FUNG|nr:hypothetical protein DM01DRAFT_1336810 [Hesseltinella vesiculosa]